MPDTIFVTARPTATEGILRFGSLVSPCALGRGGLKAEAEKREGDGATPIGRFPFRRLYRRADRLPELASSLPTEDLTPAHGWCDAPDDPAYNRPVAHPYPASAERLWREDHLYDGILVIGHNDAPVRPHYGSAIFLHLANEEGSGFRATEGCVALRRDDFLALVAALTPATEIDIRAE